MLDIHYHKLVIDVDDIRLLTILPAPEGGDGSQAPVHCRLDTFHYCDHAHTAAYQAFLDALEDPTDRRARLEWQQACRASNLQEAREWVRVDRPNEDATARLPEFRYTWGDFVALSYTWGRSTVTREVVVNDLPVLVTENLEACLRVLRDKPFIQQGWKIWIDAICINQGDLPERARHVQRMREIYVRAWTPIVWLGKEADDSDGALELVRELVETYPSLDQVSTLTQDLYRDPELFGEGRWRALYLLATRPYWRRLWIMQEISLGRADTPVLCGQKSVPWEQLSRTFGLLNKTDEVINVFIANELKDAGREFDIVLWVNLLVVSEIQLLQDASLGHGNTNFYRLMHLARNVLATNTRDKIYGLVAVMDPSVAQAIEPDYTADITDVFIDFAKISIAQTGSLDIIRHRFPTEMPGLPAWVPDWNIEPSTSPLNFGNATYTASGSSKADVHFLPDSNDMSCKGFQIDEFDGMGAMWAKGWSSDTVGKSSGSANPYGNFSAAREAIWRSMVVNRTLAHDPLEADHSALLAVPSLATSKLDSHDSVMKELLASNVFDWCNLFLQGNADFRICGREMREYWLNQSPDEVDASLLRDALMQRDRVNVRRRLVTTKKGYVGMALEAVEPGDVICVLLGCTVPMVLRPAGDKYQVVGECYLHGLMEGQALKWVEDGVHQLDDFILL